MLVSKPASRFGHFDQFNVRTRSQSSTRPRVPNPNNNMGTPLRLLKSTLSPLTWHLKRSLSPLPNDWHDLLETKRVRPLFASISFSIFRWKTQHHFAAKSPMHLFADCLRRQNRVGSAAVVRCGCPSPACASRKKKTPPKSSCRWTTVDRGRT